MFVWAGDIHINSTTAVCVPEFEKDNGDIHTSGRLQRALWAAWLDACGEVKKLHNRGWEIVTCIGGEIADESSKHLTYEYITHNTDDIRRMSLDTLDPLLQVTDKLIVLRGTEAHSGIASNLDEGIAREIAKGYDLQVIRDGKRYSHYYIKRYIGGRLFDLAHHVSNGHARRTQKDVANHLSADLQMDYVRNWSRRKSTRFELPDFALRGHVHKHSDSYDNFPIRSIICPAWQTKTSYVHRIGASVEISDIGMILVEPASKRVEWLRYETDYQAPVHV